MPSVRLFASTSTSAIAGTSTGTSNVISNVNANADKNNPHTNTIQDSFDTYTIEEERIINVLSRKLEQVCFSLDDFLLFYLRSLTNHTILISPANEQLRESKLENPQPVDSESERDQVSKLTREMGELKRVNGELEMQLKSLRVEEEGRVRAGAGAGAGAGSSSNGNGVNGHSRSSPSETGQRHLSASAEVEVDAEVEVEAEPESSVEMLLEAMRRENEESRNRLADTQRGYMRISRLNEVYREELIEHRRRVSS
jgi:hypothetical protein